MRTHRRIISILMGCLIGYIAREGLQIMMFFRYASSLLETRIHAYDLRSLERLPSTLVGSSTVEKFLQHGSISSSKSRPVEFVFFVGLEGTGHHFMGAALENSPTAKLLCHRNIHPTILKDLHDALFRRIPRDGLWNAHCWGGNRTKDLQDAENRVVNNLARIQEQVLGVSNLPTHNPVYIPINTLGDTVSYGQVSYPNMKGGCRSLNYPSLDVLYNACEKADVECKHIYIHRRPQDVLISTTMKRSFNRKGLLNAIHLYRSMLHIIVSEMQTHSRKTLGCFGLFGDPGSWWQPIRELGGWTNQTEYNIYMNATYHPPGLSMKSEKLPGDLEPYMNAFRMIHEKAKWVCESNLLQQVNDVSIDDDAYLIGSAVKNPNPEFSQNSLDSDAARKSPDKAKVEFVIVLGLESAGIKLIGTQLQEVVQRNLQGVQSKLSQLQHLFFDSLEQKGLWNAHCAHQNESHFNISHVETQVVQTMQNIYEEAILGSHEHVLRIPVLLHHSELNETLQSFSSHPASTGDCRELDYASLDLWYGACRKAKVFCRHVYIHHDEGDFVRALMNTRGAEDEKEKRSRILKELHVFTSHLHILSSEMDTHSAKALACLNLNPNEDGWKEFWELWSVPHVSESIARALSRYGKNRQNTSSASVHGVTPYLKAFRQAYEKACAVCRRGSLSNGI